MLDLLREIFIKFRKIIVFIFITGISLSFLIAKVNAGTGTASVNTGEKRFTNYTVEYGDTIWDIAEKNMDHNHYDSIYEYINEIRRMNNLKSDNIYAGQNLIITYYTYDTYDINCPLYEYADVVPASH